MQEAIAKADVLIEAMSWIREFRDKVTVIKVGGSVTEDREAMRQLLIDIVFLETVGMRPIVVHGGGSMINRAMKEANMDNLEFRHSTYYLRLMIRRRRRET